MAEPVGGAPGSLYDHAPCGLLLTDDDGLLLRANATFCDWIGTDAGALVGKRRFQDLLTVGGRIFHQTQWMPLLRMQGSVAEVKLDIQRDGQPPLPMLMNAIRREREGGATHELALFVAKDRQAYERELLLARKRAEQLHEEQRKAREFAEQMMAIVSHDLRSPLGTIRTGADVLKLVDLPERIRPLQGNIERAADRALHMVNDLLDLTAARLGREMPLKPRDIDLHETIAGLVAELALAHPEAQLEHRRSGDGRCSGDPLRLGQLVGNLVANAIVYGSREAPIVVTTAVEDGHCSLGVRNAGPPIPESTRATLFQPMVRGTDVGTETRSVGLGLYIVAEIARAHGGEVRLASSNDDGTEFVARFPARRRSTPPESSS